jgi:septal ring factor EnvC (AmiA/AmiB activator)
MMKKIINSALVVVLAAGIIGFTGCSGVSEEQMAELEALRSEVKALEKEVGSLKTEKAAIEREIAEKNAKLDQCAKEKADTKKNLEKIGL